MTADPLALEELTAREREVLDLLAHGWSNEAIAETLVVTERTVESHIWSILLKLGLMPDQRINRRVLAARLWLTRRERQVASAAGLG